uniref:Uncharacterized protein n=1 Tax=Romanomermis culicivorax TaxID=13658 RepID=A0A915HQD0_ROMCU
MPAAAGVTTSAAAHDVQHCPEIWDDCCHPIECSEALKVDVFERVWTLGVCLYRMGGAKKRKWDSPKNALTSFPRRSMVPLIDGRTLLATLLWNTKRWEIASYVPITPGFARRRRWWTWYLGQRTTILLNVFLLTNVQFSHDPTRQL